MSKIYLIILFLSLQNISGPKTHDQNVLKQFLLKIKEGDYEKAMIVAKEFSNEDWQVQFKQLASVRYWAGQKPFSLNPYEGESELLESIFFLSAGYHELYKNPYDWKSFENFSKAYSIIQSFEDNELEKLALLAIIEVYNREFSQTNYEVLIYLQQFEKLVDCNEDLFHLRLNKLIFQLRNVFYEVKMDEDFLNDFENLMKNFDRDHHFIPIYNSTIGVYYEVLGNDSLAGQLHESVLKNINEDPHLKHIKFRSLIHLSEIMRRRSRFNDGLEYLKQASKYKSLADTLRSSYYLNFYAAPHYAGLEEYDTAYKLMRISNDLEKQLGYERNSQVISKLNTKYQTAKKEKQILKEQQRVRKTLSWLIASGILLIFSIGITILLHKNNAKKRQLAEQEVIMKQQRVDNLLKEQELVSIDSMIAGQEKERQRLANDLHDNLGSLLTSLKMHFQSLKQDLNNNEEKEITKKTEALMEEAYQKVRSIAHVRNAGLKANEGLLPAVHSFAKKVSVMDKLAVQVEEHGMTERLENSLEITIFRVIQELVTNVAKHANATECTVHLTNHNHTLNIMVEDNGKGFEISEITKKEGMGLYSIQKRVENLDGQVTIDSISKKGTSIIIDIPIA